MLKERRHKKEEAVKNSGTDHCSPRQKERGKTAQPHAHTDKKKDRRE